MSVSSQAKATTAASNLVCLSFLLRCSGAEGAPADLRGRGQQSTRPGFHQSGPPRQAGRADQVKGQRLEGRHRPRRGLVRRPRGVQHWLVSSRSRFLSQVPLTPGSKVKKSEMLAFCFKGTLSAVAATQQRCWGFNSLVASSPCLVSTFDRLSRNYELKFGSDN